MRIFMILSLMFSVLVGCSDSEPAKEEPKKEAPQAKPAKKAPAAPKANAPAGPAGQPAPGAKAPGAAPAPRTESIHEQKQTTALTALLP